MSTDQFFFVSPLTCTLVPVFGTFTLVQRPMCHRPSPGSAPSTRSSCRRRPTHPARGDRRRHAVFVQRDRVGRLEPEGRVVRLVRPRPTLPSAQCSSAGGRRRGGSRRRPDGRRRCFRCTGYSSSGRARRPGTGSRSIQFGTSGAAEVVRRAVRGGRRTARSCRRCTAGTRRRTSCCTPVISVPVVTSNPPVAGPYVQPVSVSAPSTGLPVTAISSTAKPGT